jgi:hypothetical protein
MTTPHARRIAGAAARLHRCFQMDARLFVRAMGWRIALPALRRVVPLRTLVHLMQRTSTHPSPARVHAVRLFAAHGGRIVMSPHCLERSLVLYRFLGEAGARPTLVLGANDTPSGLAGHAWVEINGEPFADTPRYAPVLAFDGQP